MMLSSAAGPAVAAAISEGSSAGTSLRPDRRLLETGDGVARIDLDCGRVVLESEDGAAASCGTRREEGLASDGGLGMAGVVTRDDVTRGVVA